MKQDDQKEIQILERAANGDMEALTLTKEGYQKFVASADAENLALLDAGTENDVSVTVPPGNHQAIAGDEKQIHHHRGIHALGHVGADIRQRASIEQEIVFKGLEDICHHKGDPNDPDTPAEEEEKNEAKTEIKVEVTSNPEKAKEIIQDAVATIAKEEGEDAAETFKKDVEEGHLTDKEQQAVNTAIVKHDKKGRLARFLYTLGNTDFSEVTGKNKQEYYEQNRERLDLDRVLHESTLRRIRRESYSSSHYADTGRAAENKEERAAAKTTGGAGTLAQEQREVAINQGLAVELTLEERNIAKQYGLDLQSQKSLIASLANNDYSTAYEYAQEHGMTALADSLSTQMENSQRSELIKPQGSPVDDLGWGAFATAVS